MVLTAKLNKAGNLALCGRRSCGAALADVVPVWDEHRGFGSERRIMFGSGWRPRLDGVYALPPRAVTRLRQGRRFITRAQEPMDFESMLGKFRHGQLTLAEAVCWRCGYVNTIDANAIRPS